MSFQALNWAVKQRVGTPVGKSLLMALANYADEKGTCFPSHERLARESELSDKSVRVHMKRLEDLGILSASRDRDDAGRLGIIRYRLTLERDFDIPPEDVRGKRKSAADDGNANEEATSEEPPAAGTGGLPEPGAAGQPAVSQVKNPPVAGTGITTSKITKDSLSPPSLETEPKPRERQDSEFDQGRSDQLFTDLATLWPMKDKFAEAKALWDTMAPADQRAALEYAPNFLAGLKKRSFIEALVSFLRGTAWRFAKPEERESPVEIKPYARKFWAWAWCGHASPKTISFNLAEAQRGKSLWLRPSEVPTDEQALSLVAVEVVSTAFAAWQEHAAAKGITLHRPDKAAVIWCPSEYPERVKAGAAA